MSFGECRIVAGIDPTQGGGPSAFRPLAFVFFHLRRPMFPASALRFRRLRGKYSRHTRVSLS